MRYWLLPLAAFLAVLPFIVGGHSCGYDFAFHMHSWLGAADQLRHGTLYPRWNFFAAYNAGEPRFIFYPPLSWMLGAILTLLLPFNLVPTVLSWLVLTLAGFTMHRLVRRFAPEPIALLAACIYLANPFMLFTITGRNAYAELLAAACCPLLIAAMLEARPNPWRVGSGFALMWLSNVPGAIIGSYSLILLAAVRLLQAAGSGRSTPWRTRLHRAFPLAAVFTAGTIYGLALTAFFLLPAVWERRYIRMADAFRPPFGPADNLFFQRVLDPVRDHFFLRTQHLYLWTTAITLFLLLGAWLLSRLHITATSSALWRQYGTPIAALAVGVTYGMTWAASFFWRKLPEIYLAQFPWRMLFILSACLAIALGLALRHSSLRMWPAAAVALATIAALTFFVVPRSRFACAADEKPPALLADFLSHHPSQPTDEYVPATGDADYLSTDNPPFWLAASPGDASPVSTPNPSSLDPDAEWPLKSPEKAHLEATPLRFTVDTPRAAYLVVNLQDYPNWRIRRNGAEPLAHLHRRDGLLAVALPAGPSTLYISWHHSPDEYLGWAITLMALAAFLLGRRRMQALLFAH